MKTPYIVVLITTKSKEEAEQVGRKLLEAKLVACANILDGVKSLFWWQGKIDEANESLLMVKSRQDLFAELAEVVKKNHSYSVPEIIALPIVDGSSTYLKWIEDSVKQ